MEQTLIIFKPDAVLRGVVGEILTRFERVGLKMIGAKMLRPDPDHLYYHYETLGTMGTRRGEAALKAQLAMMQEGPVLAVVLEGIEAAELVRKMVGATEPKSALPGTIRGDYSHLSYAHANKESIGVPNLIHASADAAEAKQEIAHWFSDSELYEYETPNEKYTQPRSRKK